MKPEWPGGSRVKAKVKEEDLLGSSRTWLRRTKEVGMVIDKLFLYLAF